MIISKKLLLFSIVVISLASCRQKAEDASKNTSVSEIGPETEVEQEMKTYKGKGLVLSITPNKKQIIVNHETIPGFMKAMTMPFNVSDPVLLDGILPKDSVWLHIDYDGTLVVLKEIEKLN